MNNVLHYIKKHNDVKKFIFLSIPYGTKEKNPLIIRFNSIIEKICNQNNGIFLNYFFEQQNDNSLVSDDLHYSKKLHKLISIKLIETISQFSNNA